MYQYIIRTKLIENRELNDKLSSQVFFKCDNLQETGSFKFRGAVSFAINLRPNEKESGIFIASSGNFAIAMITVCGLFGIKLNEIVLPETAKHIKIDFIKKNSNANLIYYSNREDRSKKVTEVKHQTNSVYVAPSNDKRFLAGYQTIIKEIWEDLKNVDCILIPVGTGALISGCALALKEIIPNARIIGCEPENVNDAYLSFHKGVLSASHHGISVADGLIENINKHTFSIISKNVDDLITVTEEEILSAMDYLKKKCNINVEPSSSVPVAALFKHRQRFIGKRVVIVLTGSNHEEVSPSRYLR